MVTYRYPSSSVTMIFWFNCVSPKYEPRIDQIRLICRRSLPKGPEGDSLIKTTEMVVAHLGALSSAEVPYGKLNIVKLVLGVEGAREDEGHSLRSSVFSSP